MRQLPAGTAENKENESGIIADAPSVDQRFTAEAVSGSRTAAAATFEEAIARLEEIVRTLESGSAPLDVSLGLFEEGVALVRLCNERLDVAEQKVKVLVRGENGEMTETDLKH